MRKALLCGTMKRHIHFVMDGAVRAFLGEDRSTEPRVRKILGCSHIELSQTFSKGLYLHLLEIIMQENETYLHELSEDDLKRQMQDHGNFPTPKDSYPEKPSVDDVCASDPFEVSVVEKKLIAHIECVRRKHTSTTTTTTRPFDATLDGSAYTDFVITSPIQVETVTITWRQYLNIRNMLRKIRKDSEGITVQEDTYRLAFEELHAEIGLYCSIRNPTCNIHSIIAWYKEITREFWISPRAAYHRVSTMQLILQCEARGIVHDVERGWWCNVLERIHLYVESCMLLSELMITSITLPLESDIKTLRPYSFPKCPHPLQCIEISGEIVDIVFPTSIPKRKRLTDVFSKELYSLKFSEVSPLFKNAFESEEIQTLGEYIERSIDKGDGTVVPSLITFKYFLEDRIDDHEDIPKLSNLSRVKRWEVIKRTYKYACETRRMPSNFQTKTLRELSRGVSRGVSFTECEDVSNDTWENCEEKTKSSNRAIAEAAFKDVEVMIRHVLVQSKSRVPDVDSKESENVETSKESEISEEDEMTEDEESDEEDSDASDNSEEEDEEDDERDEYDEDVDDDDDDHELHTFFFEIEGSKSLPALVHKAAKRSADRLSSTLDEDSTLGPSTPQRRRYNTESIPSSIQQAARRSAKRNAARGNSSSRTCSISQKLFFEEIDSNTSAHSNARTSAEPMDTSVRESDEDV